MFRLAKMGVMALALLGTAVGSRAASPEPPSPSSTGRVLWQYETGG